MMSTPIVVGGIEIGPRRCFIIAEAGVNHDGDPDRALALVAAAKGAGASCVKFQTFQADTLATATASKAEYQRRSSAAAESQRDMLRNLELSRPDLLRIARASESMGIVFLSTPYSDDDADFLDSIGVGAFKLASMHCTEPQFIAHVARKGKPVILSTGMATLEDVAVAVDAFRSTGNEQLVLLQCTTEYPAPVDAANLRAMITMRDAFGVQVGFSDHTCSPVAGVGAVAMGAVVIEKHLTLDRTLSGPDHAASLDPMQFEQFVGAIREMESALGSGIKSPTIREHENAAVMKRSLASRHFLAAGTLLTENDLRLMRPGTGLRPDQAGEILGRRVTQDIPAGTLLGVEHVTDRAMTDSAIAFRRLAAADAPAIAGLLGGQSSGYLRYFDPFSWSPEELASMLGSAVKDVYWGIESGGRAAGVVMLRGFDEGFERPSLGLVVAEEMSGRGVGQAAVAHALAWCRVNGVREVRLTAADENGSAVRLFRRAGFVADDSPARPGFRAYVLRIGAS